MNRYDHAARCLPSKTLFVAVIVLCAFWLGTLTRDDSVANAEVRTGKPQQAFKSGATRSLVILEDISITLKQIDVRLKKIEAVAISSSQK